MNPVPAFGFSVFLMPLPSAFDPRDALSDTIGAGAAAALNQSIAPATPSAPILIGFSEVHGLDAGMDVETLQEGGLNFAPRRFMSRGRFPNIVCRRGITASTDLANWYRQVQLDATAPERRNGFVVLHSHGGPGGTPVGGGAIPIAAWFFQRALPEKLDGPTLNARVNEIAIEKLELSHEGLVRLKNSELGIGAGAIPGVVGS
jgi:phage tail-like protein